MSDVARQITVLERMLGNEATVSRLPDGGDALRARLALLKSQQAQQQQQQQTTAPEESEANAPAPEDEAPNPRAATSVRGTDGGMTAAERLAAHTAEGERTRFVEPDVKHAMAAAFKGVLSRREIAKLVVSSGATRGNYASWDETQRMLAADREAERERELERLRRITAPPGGNAQQATASSMMGVPASRRAATKAGMDQLMKAFEELPAPSSAS